MPPLPHPRGLQSALGASRSESEPSIGLLLPCNVVVRQDEAGTVHVEFMDPNSVLELVNKPEVTALAGLKKQAARKPTR